VPSSETTLWLRGRGRRGGLFFFGFSSFFVFVYFLCSLAFFCSCRPSDHSLLHRLWLDDAPVLVTVAARERLNSTRRCHWKNSPRSFWPGFLRATVVRLLCVRVCPPPPWFRPVSIRSQHALSFLSFPCQRSHPSCCCCVCNASALASASPTTATATASEDAVARGIASLYQAFRTSGTPEVTVREVYHLLAVVRGCCEWSMRACVRGSRGTVQLLWLLQQHVAVH